MGLTDGYQWHRQIWDSFPGRPESERDFLFRTDQFDKAFRVLLLSGDVPESTGHLLWQTKTVAESFLKYSHYRFQLKANPTFRRSADGRRLAIFDELQLKEWLDRKAVAGGFRVDPASLVVGAPQTEVFNKNGRRGTHVAVDFQGILQVHDLPIFTESFQHGIGSAKGFGYGLLMLEPVR